MSWTRIYTEGLSGKTGVTAVICNNLVTKPCLLPSNRKYPSNVR